MTFPLNVYIAALCGSLLVSFLTAPLWRKLCRRIGLVDEPGHRKIHDRTITLSGGFTVLTGMLVPLLLGVAAVYFDMPGLSQGHHFLEYGFGVRKIELAAIFIGALGIVIIGALDDRFELRPSFKFTGQLLVAILVTAAKVRITLFVPSLAFSYAISILWILTVINAFNFMDNMNGLCAGLGLVSAWFFMLIAAISGQYLVALLSLLVCGALIGFLPYNFPKATAFLGDTGSHLVGYLLAVIAILPHFSTAKHTRHWAVIIPLVVLAVPLGDLVWVVWLRWQLSQPFYQGDNNHLSHRMVKNGYTREKAVLIIWLFAALCGTAGLILMLLGR